MKKTFMEFMLDERMVNRWLLLKVALAGAFCGAVLSTIFNIGGLILK